MSSSCAARSAGYFTWRVEDGGPLLLLAGGSGLVPLMAMLRHRAARSSELDARLLVSARSLDDVLYRDELETLAATDGFSCIARLPASRRWAGPGSRGASTQRC